MNTKKMIIVGAGGHAKVVIDAFLLTNNQANIQIFDDNFQLEGKLIYGAFSIKAPINLNPLPEDGAFIHVAIGNNKVRRMLLEKAANLGYELKTIHHPFASAALGVEIKKGTFVAAYSIVGPDSTIGVGVIVNHGAIIDHDCEVGDYTHIAPNVTLGGGVIIGRGCLVGSGSVVLPGKKIGNNVIIGAGAVVTKDIPNDQVVLGNPARKR